ncbi:hypothetical protein B0O99DRAFT_639113 [Bisporella sp. PMI_857]|nr:hypothetical protein B0O99DRAFT_639113 [Bisporella sp. PMI_857]
MDCLSMLLKIWSLLLEMHMNIGLPSILGGSFYCGQIRSVSINTPYLMTYSLADGRQFVTAKFVNMDDELWLLYGARLPVILRPENDDMYGFLSECVPLE